MSSRVLSCIEMCQCFMWLFTDLLLRCLNKGDHLLYVGHVSQCSDFLFCFLFLFYLQYVRKSMLINLVNAH